MRVPHLSVCHLSCTEVFATCCNFSSHNTYRGQQNSEWWHFTMHLNPGVLMWTLVKLTEWNLPSAVNMQMCALKANSWFTVILDVSRATNWDPTLLHSPGPLKDDTASNDTWGFPIHCECRHQIQPVDGARPYGKCPHWTGLVRKAVRPCFLLQKRYRIGMQRCTLP